MISSIKTIIPNVLYQGPRPGYERYTRHGLWKSDIEHDIDYIARTYKSVLCLMPTRELKKHYNFNLLKTYESKNLIVARYSVNDNDFMCNTETKDEFFDYNETYKIFDNLPKPIYLHCSAGVMRSKHLAEKFYQYYITNYKGKDG